MDRNHICEEKIQEHDPVFYEGIRPHVPFMPDFRPPETMKYMKMEPQLNWCVIYSELEAMAYDKDALEFIEMVNDEDPYVVFRTININGVLINRFEYYAYERSDITENFFALYPALTWLLLRIGNEKIMKPLFISQGLYLNEINIDVNDVEYIKDEETARKIIEEFPSLRSSRLSPKRSRGGRIILDYIQYPKEFLDHKSQYLRRTLSIPYSIYFSFVFSKVKDYLSSDDLMSLYKDLIFSRKEEEEKMRLIIFHDKFPNPYQFEIVATLMGRGYNNIALSLLNQKDIPNMKQLLFYANSELLPILLQDERFDHIKESTLYDILTDAVMKVRPHNERIERLKILLDDGRFFENGVAQRVVAKYINGLDILNIFLSYPQMDIEEILLFSLRKGVSDSTLVHILSSPQFDPRILNNPQIREKDYKRIMDLAIRENISSIVER